MYQRPASFKLLPDVIKNLLIINGLFFLATLVLGNVFQWDLIRILGLYLPGSPHFEPYQLVTHMFMHGGIGHVFFNMFALWMFGYSLENVWGSKRFLIYYLITGFGAAILHLGINYWTAQGLEAQLIAAGFTESDLVNLLQTGSWDSAHIKYISREVVSEYYGLYSYPTVGASGAVFGILLAFGMMFPNVKIYLYFAIPVKAKYFVIGYGLLELFNGIARTNDGIAHFAHLGGMLFGFLLIKYWNKNGMYQY